MLHFFSRIANRLLMLLFSRDTYGRIKKSIRSRLAIKRHSGIDPSIPHGINLVGYFRAGMGLGEGCRLLSRAIVSVGIPLCPINFSRNALSQRSDTWSDLRFNKRPRYGLTLVHVNPDQYRLFETDLPRSLWKGRYVVGFLLWELPLLPESWREGIGLLDEIWTSSDFIANNIRAQVNIPVRVIPYGIPIRSGNARSRVSLGMREGQFLFLVMYDTASIMERKNPRGAIEAFMRAFGPGDDRVGIIIKINNSRHAPDELANLKDMLKEYSNARFIEDAYSRDEVDALIRACDAVVSLHRAEGFGLVLAEAMSFGKPVVATNWSANTEFMDASNSCPVDYQLVELGRDYGHYRAAPGQYWVQPDIEHAASLMRRLVEDAAYRESIGRMAKERIARDFSPEASGRLIAGRLRELGLWE